MSYANFRKQNNDIDALQEKFNKLNGKQSFNEFDETYWDTKHVMGADGKGEAIVRFLPAPPDGNGGQEPDQIVQYFQYSMYRNGKNYIQRGRNSLGKDEQDPAYEYSNSIWARKDLTKDEKIKLLPGRQEYFIANIYVVSDPNKPENEGKVFRWRFGKQIYNLIQEKLFPEFATTPKVVVFDPIVGADFLFRVVSKKIPDRRTGELTSVPNYEKSEFAAPSKRWDVDNGEFDEVWKRQYSLVSEVAEDKFKPYDQLKRQWDRVMGNVEDAPVSRESTSTARTERATESKATQASKTNEDEFDFDQQDEDQAPWDIGEVEPKQTKQTATTSDDDDWFSNLGD